MAVRITAAYLKAQQKAGNIRGFSEATPAIIGTKKARKKQRQQDSAGILFIKDVLDQNGVGYQQEYRFDDDRFWRFDLVLLPIERKLAIEYDGINSKKSRHTTKSGFTEDHNKINRAMQLGWRVFRYTKDNMHQVEQDIKQL